MKGNTYAAFLTLLLLFIYPLVWGIQADVSTNMARFLPENTLGYFEQYNGSKVVKEFTGSPLGQKFSTIDFLQTARKIGLPEPTLDAMAYLFSSISSAKDNKLIHEVFGRMFAVAILPPIDRDKYPPFTDYIKDNVIFIARPQHRAEGLEFLGESFGKYFQAYSVSSSPYGNHRIKRIHINGTSFAMTTIEGYFLMSFNENQLRRCINTYDAEVPALSKNIDFMAMRKKFKMSDRFFYFPVDRVRKYVDTTIADLSFAGKDVVQKELGTMVGFANFGYGSWNHKGQVSDRVVVQYDKEEVNKVVKRHIKTAPKQCAMLSLSTENPLAFYWSNTIKMEHILRYVGSSGSDEPQLLNFWATLEKITGKTPEEIFALLGEEMSFVIEPGPADKFFSVPLGISFLHVKNVPELKAVFEKLIDEYDLQISVKSYGKIRYSYWTPSPQDGLQPLYGFWDDLVFFGNSSSLLRRIIDRKSGGGSLLDSSAIKAIDPGFSEKNNSVSYVNNIALIQVLQRWLDLVAMTIAIEDRHTAFKVRAVIDEVINPLLDGAKMYDKRCTRSYFTPETIVVDSITNKAIVPHSKRKN